MDLHPFLANVAIRSSAILAVIFGILILLKRASAAERHLVILLGLVIVALIPAGLLLSPKLTWIVPMPVERVTIVQASVKEVPAEQSSNIANSAIAQPPVVIVTRTQTIAFLLVAGALVQVLLLAHAAWSWHRIRRNAKPTHLPSGVLERTKSFVDAKGMPPVLVSDEIRVPVLIGWLRPAIILPSAILQATENKLFMVLCHELAHFRRGDSRLLPLLALLRLVYWWHPLMWLALARLRREREGACDDLVLAHGLRATDYADLIVNVAREIKDPSPTPFGAMAMASSSSVGERIGAILNPALHRRQPSRAMIFTGLIIAFAIGWLVVATEVTAGEASPVALAKASASQIEVGFQLVEIDEKLYHEKMPGIAEPIEKKDLALFLKLPGSSVLSSPHVTTSVGQEADIEMFKGVLHQAVDGTTHTVPLGVGVKITPSLSKNGTTLLDYSVSYTELRLQKNDFFQRTMRARDRQIADSYPIAFWLSESTDNSLVSFLTDKSQILPFKAKSHLNLLCIIMARRADGKATTTPVPEAPAPIMLPGPKFEVGFTFLEIDDEVYSKNASAINEALKKGDIEFFKNLHGVSIHLNPKVMAGLGMQKSAPNQTTPDSSFSSVIADGKPVLISNIVVSEYTGIMKGLDGEMGPGTTITQHSYGVDETDLINGHAIGRWVDEKHQFMQFSLPNPKYKRFAFFLTGHQVAN
jgi:beta-lactamase regulating signal transducer with metallopeptidase domain